MRNVSGQTQAATYPAVGSKEEKEGRGGRGGREGDEGEEGGGGRRRREGLPITNIYLY